MKTVEIPDALFAEANAVAERRGIPLRKLVEDGLRAGIRQYDAPHGHFRLKDGSFGGDGPAKGLSWQETRAIIYEGRGE